MSKRVSYWIPLVLAGLIPATVLAEDVCDLLPIVKVNGPATFPSNVPVVKPDIRELPIQVYTTRAVGTTGAALDHKCELAHDLADVNNTMKDVGFDGYTGTDYPLFANAGVLSVPSAQIDTVRNVVREILDPLGDADSAIAALQNTPDLYNDTVLNVYYVHAEQGVFDWVSRLTGMHLRDEDGNSAKMIFIGEDAKSDTVAHEFGHAFSAGHVNFWSFDGTEYCAKYLPHPGTATPQIDMQCEFSKENIMWAAGENRTKFVQAQKERMLRNEHSLIFLYSQSDKPLKCPDASSDPKDDTPEDDGCPRLGQ